MEKHDLTFISKKRRIDYMITENIPNTKNEESSKVLQSAFATIKFAENTIYRLYFKGLVSNETSADRETVVKVGFGIAICDRTNNFLYGINESFNSAVINCEEVEIVALIIGLKEAIRLGARNVVICCDDYQIYKIIIGKEKPNHKNLNHVEEVLRLRGRMAFAEPIWVAEHVAKCAFELARDAIVSQSSSTSVYGKASQKETCTICVEETDAELMFLNDKCFHRHCFTCVKRYAEEKLLMGALPTCLVCKVELTLESCIKVLTPKLIEMWKHKIEEDLIPDAEKIYCPYPRCSMLMSKTELSSGVDQSNVRSCIKCYGLFCIDCKVPWHSDLSCGEFKKLHPEHPIDDMKLLSLANDNMWRQCDRCKHMIELYEGCSHMTCRCGYQFCYKCGIEWTSQGGCPSGCLPFDTGDDSDDSDDDDSDDSDDDDSDDDGDYDDDDYDDEGGEKYLSEAGSSWLSYREYVDEHILMMMSKKD